MIDYLIPLATFFLGFLIGHYKGFQSGADYTIQRWRDHYRHVWPDDDDDWNDAA